MADIFFVALSIGLFAIGIWFIKGLHGLDEEGAND